METGLIEWINSYLTERPQYVRLGNTVSDIVETSIGAPQGTVLSPFLFTLYTSDFSYRTPSCHIQKYSDDTVVAACVRGGDEEEYRRVISEFVIWSRHNGLILNTTKTKEMIVDFGRRKAHLHLPVVIEGEEIEVVQTYKYLGVHLDQKLDWSIHVNAAYRKGCTPLMTAPVQPLPGPTSDLPAPESSPVVPAPSSLLPVNETRSNNDCKKVRIGPNTSIGAEQFGHMKWTDAKKAAKDLLVAVFGRATLATHCYTGKSSNAFKDKEAKPQLEAQKVSDIIGE
ncbi:unnamed protein product [Leuciscus chuanchicus]